MKVEFYVCEHPVTGEMIEDVIEVEFPSHKEVCPCCGGEGSTYLGWHNHEQPAFTGEDWAREDPDFREDYINGLYDKPCPECKGLRVVDVANGSGPLWDAYLEYLKEEAYHQAECDAERRMGA